MSGLEAVGIAASIIQIADLGTKLSVKLFSFYRQIQNANQAIQHLSSDVALTCAILRELGDSLKQDEQSKLCSPEAHLTARQMLKQCEDVLWQIQTMIDESHVSGKSRWQQATSKLRNVLNEPDVNFVRGNLERLKSTMLLLLNVIMFAGQIRNNHIPEMLNEQRNLINILLKEKANAKVDSIATANLTPTICLTSLAQPLKPAISFEMHSQPSLAYPPLAQQEVQDYNLLIKAMLREIDGCRSKLEKSRHSRIRDGVLNVHSSEIVHFQRNYGSSIFQCFDETIFEYDAAREAPAISNSMLSSAEASGELGISVDHYAVMEHSTPGLAEYSVPGSFFTPLTSPALPPSDFWAARTEDSEDVDLFDRFMFGDKTKSAQHSMASPALRPTMHNGDTISSEEFYISTKSNYQNILDGTQVPGISYLAPTSNTLTSKRTSHKSASQPRRNRINCALRDLEKLIPPTFLQDQQAQKLAAPGTNTGEKEGKEPSQVIGKALVLEKAIQYIKELKVWLKDPEASAESESPANLSPEHDLPKVQVQGLRNRINIALKEIELMIPSEFVQPRLIKELAISEISPEGNTKGKFVTPARSKASTVEIAVEYIRDLQQKLENTPGTLASRLMPPRAPSPNGRAESQGEEHRPDTTRPPDEPTEINAEIPARPLASSIGEDRTSSTGLPSDMPCSGLGSSQKTTKQTTSAKRTNRGQGIVDEEKLSGKEYGVNPQPRGYSENSYDDSRGTIILPDGENTTNPQIQRQQARNPTRRAHQSSGIKYKCREHHTQKRKFSETGTLNPVAVASVPLIEERQEMSKGITSNGTVLGISSEKYLDVSIDPLWPSSLEKALERWTNLKQNEINVDIAG